MMKKTLCLVVAFVLVGCVTGPPSDRYLDPGPMLIDIPGIVDAWFTENLFDPDSVKDLGISATDARWYRPPLSSEWVGVWAVCIRFNAVNRLGAYVGRQERYLAIRHGVVLGTRETCDWPR